MIAVLGRPGSVMPSNYAAIREDNIKRRGEDFDDIGRLVAEQLYSDRTHFIYELLQNTEDALKRRFRDQGEPRCRRSVSFRLYRDRLELRHYGKPFDEADVRAITDIL